MHEDHFNPTFVGKTWRVNLLGIYMFLLDFSWRVPGLSQRPTPSSPSNVLWMQDIDPPAWTDDKKGTLEF